MLAAMFKYPHYETIIMPRYLLEKYSSMFINESEANDVADQTRLDRVIELSMNLWYKEYFPNVDGAFDIMQAEWSMPKILFKWMLSGRIVEEPDLELNNVSWGVACNALFVADIKNWVRGDGMAHQALAA
jgi:hypothetical protein